MARVPPHLRTQELSKAVAWARNKYPGLEVREGTTREQLLADVNGWLEANKANVKAASSKAKENAAAPAPPAAQPTSTPGFTLVVPEKGDPGAAALVQGEPAPGQPEIVQPSKELLAAAQAQPGTGIVPTLPGAAPAAALAPAPAPAMAAPAAPFAPASGSNLDPRVAKGFAPGPPRRTVTLRTPDGAPLLEDTDPVLPEEAAMRPFIQQQNMVNYNQVAKDPLGNLDPFADKAPPNTIPHGPQKFIPFRHPPQTVWLLNQRTRVAHRPTELLMRNGDLQPWMQETPPPGYAVGS